jgi:hypothetical protein
MVHRHGKWPATLVSTGGDDGRGKMRVLPAQSDFFGGSAADGILGDRA